MRELVRRVARIREVLDHHPDGPVLGYFPPGRVVSESDLPPGLAEVLAVTDGPWVGDIGVFSYARQGPNRYLEQAVAIPDGEAGRWMCFGERYQEPLLVHRDTGEVWWFPENGVVWPDNPEFRKLTDTVEEFVVHYMLGPGYLDICVAPDDDEWARLLGELGWADLSVLKG